MVNVCVNVTKCAVKSTRESPFLIRGLALVFRSFFWLRFGVTLFASLKRTVGTLLTFTVCVSVSPQVMVKLMRRVSGQQKCT